MAWVLPLLENLGQDKRVESILVPCLDAGSIPAISTKKALYHSDTALFCICVIIILASCQLQLLLVAAMRTSRQTAGG